MMGGKLKLACRLRRPFAHPPPCIHNDNVRHLMHMHTVCTSAGTNARHGGTKQVPESSHLSVLWTVHLDWMQSCWQWLERVEVDHRSVVRRLLQNLRCIGDGCRGRPRAPALPGDGIIPGNSQACHVSSVIYAARWHTTRRRDL